MKLCFFTLAVFFRIPTFCLRGKWGKSQMLMRRGANKENLFVIETKKSKKKGTRKGAIKRNRKTTHPR